jgi:large subunit ribosomal protein L22
VYKLLDSAISNARQKDQNIDLDTLRVKTVFADKAPDRFMRRWRPRAQGRATRIVKGMSHITLVVSDEN